MESIIGWTATVLCFVFLVAGLTGVFGGAHRDARLLRECMEDGRKEYECGAMIYGGRH
jgi:hypothetical protein